MGKHISVFPFPSLCFPFFVLFPSLMKIRVAAAASSIRGYNSWDNYLGNPNETETLGIAQYMADELLPYNYNFVTIDAGWYFLDNQSISIDTNGRPTPRTDQYPSASNGKGFLSLSDQIHAMGLKFGVWTIRGIPVEAVQENLPIFDSSYTMNQAFRKDRPCGWDNHCYGCQSLNSDGTGGCNQAAQDYYRSVALWYAEQGIDLVKLDCMFPANHGPQGYYDDDDYAMTAAFKEQNILISLSPGRLVSTQNASWVASSQGPQTQYRVSEDFWDYWFDDYVSGLRTKLDLAVQFKDYFGLNDTYPDLDMLVIGRVMSHQHPPLVPTNFTQDEVILAFTLWCATGAPLVLGCRLPFLDDDPVDQFTKQIITNTDILLMHNESYQRQPVTTGINQTYAWTSVSTNSTASSPMVYLSLYNGDEVPHTVTVQLSGTNLPLTYTYCATDLWAHNGLPGTFTTSFGMPLRPHQAGAYLLQVCA